MNNLQIFDRGGQLYTDSREGQAAIRSRRRRSTDGNTLTPEEFKKE